MLRETLSRVASGYGRRAATLLFGIPLILTVAGCNGLTAPTTSTTGKATHTGTATLLRVDDAWHPDPAQRRPTVIGGDMALSERRFVPVRGKNHVSGLDGPERIVTDQDFVTVTLNSAFIKYFKEGSGDSGLLQLLGAGGASRKGEIAVVLSFDGGEISKQSILIYASQGQTLGSLLDFDDLPVIGPMKVESDNLFVRVVIIELDQAENEQRREFVKSLSQSAATFAPQYGWAVTIAQSIAEFIIDQNIDDVVLDHRFALKRVDSGQLLTTTPLLFGKYILMLQEDRLVGSDTERVTPHALNPIVPGDVRFDTHTDRVYKAYNYCTQEHGSAEGYIDWSVYYPSEPEVNCDWANLDSTVNSPAAVQVRQHSLGYRKALLSSYETYGSLNKVLDLAYQEACRTVRASAKASVGTDSFCSRRKRADGSLVFEYPIVTRHDAYTLLAQYPLHTHIVLSVDRSLGGTGGMAQDRFQAYRDFLTAELEAARESNRAATLANQIRDAVSTRKRHEVLFKKLRAMKDASKPSKVCLLWKEGLRSSPATAALSNADLYNEMFHITGEIWNESEDVTAYMTAQKCKVDTAKNTCTCT